MVVKDGRLVLTRPHAPPRAWPVTRDTREGVLRTLVAGPLVVHVTATGCRDDMSGMPRPQAVRFVLDGREVQGCGGDPRALLVGAPWRVTHLAGEPLPADAAPTIRFRAARLTVDGPCGTRHLSWRLTGDGLRFAAGGSDPDATCGSDDLERHRRLHALLSAVSHFDVDTPGQLRLQGGGELLAVRSDKPFP